jgi:branched-chain amino acid transport system permease protein
MIVQIVQQITSGIAIGSIYALVGLAFSLTVKALNAINFAQGDIFMLGAYFCITFLFFLRTPFWLSIIGTIAVVSLIGILFERVAYKPLYRARLGRAQHHVILIISTIGTGIFLQNAAMLVWGPDALSFPRIFPKEPLNIFGVLLPLEYVWVIAVAIFFMVTLHFLLQKTRLGKGLRATAQDRETAALMGVNLSLADSLTFGLSAALSAVGGIVIAPISFATPTMGLAYGLKGFTAAVVGGLGSIRGAIAGGILLGILENLVTGFISSTYKDIVAFSILIIFLLFRPSGLLLKPPQQKV